MFSEKLLIDDPAFLRLGVVLLGTTLARLFPNVQRLGGSFLGNNVCYECLASPLISSHLIGHIEEIFRQLCLSPPDMRVVRQPKNNVIEWAKYVGQKHFAILVSSFDDDIMEMVEVDNRYEYVGGEVELNTGPLKEVIIRIEAGLASSDQRTPCCRIHAIFPSNAKKRRTLSRSIGSTINSPQLFAYCEKLNTAIFSEEGMRFIEIIYSWWRKTFLQLNGLCTYSFSSLKQVNACVSHPMQKFSWVNDHFEFGKILQIKNSRWFFEQGYLMCNSERRKIWKWFSSTSGYKIFASLFCTKDRLVLELRSLLDVFVRFVENCALSVSAHLTSTKGFPKFLWSDVMEDYSNLFVHISEHVATEIASCVWMYVDSIGREWPLGRVSVIPLRSMFSLGVDSRLWAVMFDPIESMEMLGNHVCSRISFYEEECRVRLFAENEDALHSLSGFARKLEAHSVKVNCCSVLGRPDLDFNSKSHDLCFSVADALQERGLFWNKDDWQEMYFSDFVMRSRMSLFMKALGRGQS